MASNPTSCIYHVWQLVQLKPGNLSHELTKVCLACGVHWETLKQGMTHDQSASS